MLKFFYQSSDERKMKEQSTVTFEEISSGVYYVRKDRLGEYPSYVGSETVVTALNKGDKVFVTGKSGMYANYELIDKI